MREYPDEVPKVTSMANVESGAKLKKLYNTFCRAELFCKSTNNNINTFHSVGYPGTGFDSHF